MGVIDISLHIIHLDDLFIYWVFMHEKGHQLRDTGIESAVMTKVKGLGKFNNRVNDVADYVVPSQGGSSFSIITSMVITANQTQGRCPETDHKFKCTTDDDCMAKLDSNLGNGIITGTCLNDTSGTTGWCEIQGWCPAEDDNVTENSMKEVENFTIFIKNSILSSIKKTYCCEIVASKGYNFRFAKYYQSEDGTECRTLHKAKAIHFEIIVSGNVGRL
uniref:P2X purinoceptor 3-like n=1 Tax=Sinocyclocheilus grahami TaxID=75366 RepID=A0A672KGH7_SINGR